MRKIVIRNKSINILFSVILFVIIFVIVAYPIGIYLLDIGLKPLYSSLIGILLGNIVAWTVLFLTIEIKPKGGEETSRKI
jgi:hypothetical protein